MSEQTYYVPELKDLREGFKFELQVYDEATDEYIDEWEEHEFDVRSGLGHDEYHTFTEGRVRALLHPTRQTHTDSRDDDGLHVALLDAIMTISQTFVNGVKEYTPAINEALSDLRDHPELKLLLSKNK